MRRKPLLFFLFSITLHTGLLWGISLSLHPGENKEKGIVIDLIASNGEALGKGGPPGAGGQSGPLVPPRRPKTRKIPTKAEKRADRPAPAQAPPAPPEGALSPSGLTAEPAADRSEGPLSPDQESEGSDDFSSPGGTSFGEGTSTGGGSGGFAGSGEESIGQGGTASRLIPPQPDGKLNPKPRYPEAARIEGKEGTALLKVTVLPTGRVGEALIERSSGHPDLDRAAVEAVARWTFSPARRGETPVVASVRLPVAFSLREP
ncbi:MAG: energy transducer TonB [Candidatus Manganitrophaceae bacterium]